MRKYDSLVVTGRKARLRYKMLMEKKRPKKSVLDPVNQSMRIGDEPIAIGSKEISCR